MKSMCHDVRRNSPSVAVCSPTSSCRRTTSWMLGVLDRAQLLVGRPRRRRAARGPRAARRAQQAADVVGAERWRGACSHGLPLSLDVLATLVQHLPAGPRSWGSRPPAGSMAKAAQPRSGTRAAGPDSAPLQERVRVTTARPAAVIVLAAGEGTRMKSADPKVLHAIGGRTLLGHALAAARGTRRRAPVRRRPARARPGRRARRRGRPRRRHRRPGRGQGHRPRRPSAPSTRCPGDLDGTVLVTYGDVPLLTADTLHGLVEAHDRRARARPPCSPPTLPDPTGYGRILRDADGAVAGDRRAEGRHRRAAGRSPRSTPASTPSTPTVLREALAQVGTDNAQGEKYLTDVLAIARGRRAAGRRAPHRGPLADRGRQRPGPAGPARRRAEPPDRRALDARRRDGRRPGHDLGRRRRRARPRRDRPARHPAARRDDDRRRRRPSARTPR